MSALIHSLAPLNFKPVSKQLRICIFCMWNIKIFHSLYATPWSERWYYENHLSSLLKNFQFISCLVRLLSMRCWWWISCPPKYWTSLNFVCKFQNCLRTKIMENALQRLLVGKFIHSKNLTPFIKSVRLKFNIFSILCSLWSQIEIDVQAPGKSTKFKSWRQTK